MDKFLIKGPSKVKGIVNISGSKNAALPILASTILFESPVILDNLPRVKGAGVIFDDSNEKMYPVRIRPRLTWHGGGSPTAIPESKKEEEL